MKGQAFLSLVFVIGGIIMLVGLTLAFFSSSFIDTGYGYQASANAEATAVSGAQDALLQLDRNTGFVPSPNPYSLAMGSTTASVTVTQNSPSANYITIFSTATVALRTRNVQVVLLSDTITGKLNVVSWTEL